MIYPNGHIDYLMYENGGALIGVAKVTMPPIKYKTVTATGAALMGDVTIPLLLLKSSCRWRSTHLSPAWKI